MASGTSKSLNRLGEQKSPYLLQHATNPVDWYPWGQEAFNAAKEQDKLIFLSVGYSTCHWCHVMEKESFENSEIAEIMNAHFINIKVDREERPDVDKVYMTFVVEANGQGGWPMSVFLTPDLKPVAGGTYFPPRDKYGRPGFTTVLNSINAKWKSDKSKFKQSGNKIMNILRSTKLYPPSVKELPSEEVFPTAVRQLSQMYEPEYGGFGREPKFPQPSILNFLFAYKAIYPQSEAAQKGEEMCLHTLNMMNRGGIHDHVGQGFARYSTDKKWHVPHFEKMLYDQAQLVNAYLDAYLVSQKTEYADVARDILTYVMRDLSHPLGGFYSAEDADSLPTFSCQEKREGAFCVWKYEAIRDLLSAPALEGKESPLMYQVFNFHYSVIEGGNLDPYQDPHDEMKNQNVLMAHGSIADTAKEFEITEEQCEDVLKRCRHILFEERKKRPRPHLDDKMVTSWNGMMLSACARAGSILKDQNYIERAIQNASFIKKYLYNDKILYRAAYKHHEDSVTLGPEIKGFSNDYAWLIRGLINLYNATADQFWLLWAERLQGKQDTLFWDKTHGGYFLSEQNDPSILLNFKEDHDVAEPSVNSVSCWNLICLSRLLKRTDFEEKAASILKLFCEKLTKIPASLPEMLVALLLFSHPNEQIVLSGDEKSPSFKSMLETIHSSSFNPNRIILMAGIDRNSLLYLRLEELKKYYPVNKEETLAYLCKDFTCSLPVKSVSSWKELVSRSVP